MSSVYSYRGVSSSFQTGLTRLSSLTCAIIKIHGWVSDRRRSRAPLEPKSPVGKVVKGEEVRVDRWIEFASLGPALFPGYHVAGLIT